MKEACQVLREPRIMSTWHWEKNMVPTWQEASSKLLGLFFQGITNINQSQDCLLDSKSLWLIHEGAFGICAAMSSYCAEFPAGADVANSFSSVIKEDEAWPYRHIVQTLGDTENRLCHCFTSLQRNSRRRIGQPHMCMSRHIEADLQSKVFMYWNKSRLHILGSYFEEQGTNYLIYKNGWNLLKALWWD